MAKHILTGEEGEEYKRLYAQFYEATAHAVAVLRQHGMDSKEFQEADAVTCKLWARLRELQGMSGQSWMA